MYKVKPCPFCGAGRECLYFVEVNSSVGIFCDSCNQTIVLEENWKEGITEKAKEKAVKAWNRRAEGEENG